jgi:hypothetical protein
MRFPWAASSAAKLLILLASASFLQISPSAAATKCPSGQILRVSLKTCVPKDQNLSVISKRVAGKQSPAKDATGAADRIGAPQPVENAAASPAQRGTTPLVEVAERRIQTVEEQRPQASAAQDAAARLSAFGSLFVGAFHSTMSMGASAFK